MKRMTEKAVELPGSFTPGNATPLVCMHAVSGCREELRHGPLTLREWALSEK
jgi:hypothetical protein